ncbi:MAG: hypothetical protein KatS3mg084_0397 [Candidatus Dojkabacteria bacterium]|nr:MAG: hypothetical protein KatS3mg084_0397 [Candidatus Dojkabacteria bacterium]
MPKESDARLKINKLLEEAGWMLENTNGKRANVRTEVTVHINTGDGSGVRFIDYVLLDDNQSPIIVIEAKAAHKDPLDAKEQAREYAWAMGVNYVILSNGETHYFWDLNHGNPVQIEKFPSLKSIEGVKEYKFDFDALASEKVESDFVVLTQISDYKSHPEWLDESTRQKFIKDNQLKFLRHYQLKAIHAIQQAVKEGKTRFLLEMATGTGKTLLSAAIIKLFLKTRNAIRVLFLVDRIELENQAYQSFVQLLKKDFRVVIYKENRDVWNSADIVVTTVQSLLKDNRYRRLFLPHDFQLVISDEAHRSISGNSRDVFEYFIGYKLGLTATPRDYLRNVDIEKLSQEDPRAFERRQLLDTYNTFGCPSGEPTFRYSLIDGVKDGYLINPVVYDARTHITTQLLSDQGYATVVRTEEGDESEKVFFSKDFEKRFFSRETNNAFCKAFLDNALRDPISGEIGKTLVFCVSQNHASKITAILNHLADQYWPGMYNSDFAVQVTSNIHDAQSYAQKFANNNLNGVTKFKEGYKSSKTRVCVTVNMMTTGYDCQDILNICLMRPIFSPTDFIQIKGRGTRTHTFSYTDENGQEIKIDKKEFYLFDFFANCEYFEEKFDYDRVLKLPISSERIDSPDETKSISIDEVTISIPDPIKTITKTHIGAEGMKIDRKFFDRFADDVKIDPIINRLYEDQEYDKLEEYVDQNLFNKPEYYFNLDKLAKALDVNRKVSVKEIIGYILGRIPKIKTKDDLIDEVFTKFLNAHNPDVDRKLLRDFIEIYVTDGDIRDIIDSKQYSRLCTNPKLSLEDIENLQTILDLVVDFIRKNIDLNAFV